MKQLLTSFAAALFAYLLCAPAAFAAEAKTDLPAQPVIVLSEAR